MGGKEERKKWKNKDSLEGVDWGTAILSEVLFSCQNSSTIIMIIKYSDTLNLTYGIMVNILKFCTPQFLTKYKQCRFRSDSS